MAKKYFTGSQLQCFLEIRVLTQNGTWLMAPHVADYWYFTRQIVFISLWHRSFKKLFIKFHPGYLGRIPAQMTFTAAQFYKAHYSER